MIFEVNQETTLSSLHLRSQTTPQQLQLHSSPTLEFAVMFHTKVLCCKRSPKRYFVGPRQRLRKLSPHRRLWDLWKDNLDSHNLLPKSPHVWVYKSIKKFVFSPWHCHGKLFRAFHAFLTKSSQSSKHHLMQKCCTFKSSTIKSRNALTTHTLNAGWEAKLPRTTQKMAILWHILWDSFTACRSVT
jgi:hypothetical protein